MVMEHKTMNIKRIISISTTLLIAAIYLFNNIKDDNYDYLLDNISNEDDYSYENGNSSDEQLNTIDISHNYEQYIDIKKTASMNGYFWIVSNISRKNIKELNIKYTIHWTVTGIHQERQRVITITNLGVGDITEELIGQEMQMYPNSDVFIDKVVITQ